MKQFRVGIVLLLLFFILGFLVSYNIFGITSFDRLVMTFFNHIRTSFGVDVMQSLTKLGEDATLFPFVGMCLIIFFIFKEWKAASVLALGIWLDDFWIGRFKDFFHVVRPSPWYGGAGGYAYPSGHVSNAAMVFFILAIGLSAIIKDKVLRIIAFSICALCIITVGISRMYLNVHWFSDVVGGILFSCGTALILFGLTSLLPQINKKIKTKTISTRKI
jgi:undecaprenyl-diphosphatase